MAQTYGKPIFVVWQGIGSQIVEVRLKKSDGTDYDLTGMTVTVSGDLDDTYLIESLACTLDATPTTGVITFSPSAEELASTGNIECQLRLDNGGAIAFSYPFILNCQAVKFSEGA